MPCGGGPSCVSEWIGMINAKICMLGDFGVGKTSLVRRFVDQAFSEKYLTTVGVKIDTKTVEISGAAIKLVVWDIAGAADLDALRQNYIKGMAGYLLVCDGTRAPTLNTANILQQTLADSHPGLPFCWLVNKSDLVSESEIADADIDPLKSQGLDVFRTSAKTGDQVEEAFQLLAQRVHHAQAGSKT